MTLIKSYSFTKVSVMGHLADDDYDNPEIITEDLKQIINVSNKRLDAPRSLLRGKKIIDRNMPLTDDSNKIDYMKLLTIVGLLLYWDEYEKKNIVCSEENNLDLCKTVVEAFHYAKLGFHFEDKYNGFSNHLIYNCESGNLPPLPEVEQELKRLGDQYNQEIQDRLRKLKKRASNKFYNPLAQKTEKFIKAIEELDLLNGNYKNLQPIMSCFNQVKVKDGYVLDGFQEGMRSYSSHMILHVRKANGTEFKFPPINYKSKILSAYLFDENPQVKLEDRFKGFDDSMYIRKLVEFARKDLVRPIWEDITVPFNEEGIWEAVLLYLAPRFMPGIWHWAYARITPVTSDAKLISKCNTIDDYYKYRNSAIVEPSISIESEDKAIVSFAAWGWYGLMHWTLEVTKDGNSVKIDAAANPASLLYYKPRIIL